MPTEEQIKYKKALEKLKSKSSKYKKNYMEFQDGDNIIRILPGHPNMDGFYVEVMFHSKGNKKDRVKVICLNGEEGTTGDTCEICPEIKELLNSKDKDDQKLGREQQGKSRFFFNCLAREEDDEQKTVECGPQLLTEILTLLASDDYADLLDPNEGVDVIVKKSGKDLNTTYKVVPKRKPSPLFDDPKKVKAFIGTDAEDTKLVDLTDLLTQFDGEPERAKLVWDEGWAALKEDAANKDEDDDEDEKPSKPASKAKTPEKAPAKKTKVVEPEPDEEGEEDEVDVTKFPKLKSRCSICGDPRYKTPSGNVCANGHGGADPLAEGERPSKPSKAYLKEFPEPVDEEEVEEEEEEAPKPKTKAKPATKKPAEDDEDDDLDSLDEILNNHKKGKSK